MEKIFPLQEILFVYMLEMGHLYFSPHCMLLCLLPLALLCSVCSFTKVSEVGRWPVQVALGTKRGRLGALWLRQPEVGRILCYINALFI